MLQVAEHGDGTSGVKEFTRRASKCIMSAVQARMRTAVATWHCMISPPLRQQTCQAHVFLTVSTQNNAVQQGLQLPPHGDALAPLSHSEHTEGQHPVLSSATLAYLTAPAYPRRSLWNALLLTGCHGVLTFCTRGTHSAGNPETRSSLLAACAHMALVCIVPALLTRLETSCFLVPLSGDVQVPVCICKLFVRLRIAAQYAIKTNLWLGLAKHVLVIAPCAPFNEKPERQDAVLRPRLCLGLIVKRDVIKVDVVNGDLHFACKVLLGACQERLYACTSQSTVTTASKAWAILDNRGFRGACAARSITCVKKNPESQNFTGCPLSIQLWKKLILS